MMAPAVAIVGGNTLATQYNPPRDAFKGSGNGGKGCNESITPALKAMEAEFGRDQLLLLGGLPIVATESSVLAMAAQHGVTAQSAAMQVSNDGARSCRLMLAKACQLSHSIECLNGRSWHGCTLSAGVPPPDAMLFVGNLAPSIDDKLLRELFVEFGPVHRAFVVRSRATSESEGYGFVEFACPGQATVAKTALAAKIIEDRSIRVDWVIASTPPQSVAQLRSRTLFIDKLPRSFVNMEAIEGLCNQIGKVTFCRLATSSSGGSRGFGFVDFADVNDASRARTKLNGSTIGEVTIRMSFGHPLKTGETIMAQKPDDKKKKKPKNGSRRGSRGGINSAYYSQLYQEQKGKPPLFRNASDPGLLRRPQGPLSMPGDFQGPGVYHPPQMRQGAGSPRRPQHPGSPGRRHYAQLQPFHPPQQWTRAAPPAPFLSSRSQSAPLMNTRRSFQQFPVGPVLQPPSQPPGMAAMAPLQRPHQHQQPHTHHQVPQDPFQQFHPQQAPQAQQFQQLQQPAKTFSSPVQCNRASQVLGLSRQAPEQPQQPAQAEEESAAAGSEVDAAFAKALDMLSNLMADEKENAGKGNTDEAASPKKPGETPSPIGPRGRRRRSGSPPKLKYQQPNTLSTSSRSWGPQTVVVTKTSPHSLFSSASRIRKSPASDGARRRVSPLKVRQALKTPIGFVGQHLQGFSGLGNLFSTTV